MRNPRNGPITVLTFSFKEGFHVYLFAAFPVLVVFLVNAGKISASDSILPLIILLSVALVASVMMGLVYGPNYRATLSASLGVASIFLYQGFRDVGMWLASAAGLSSVSVRHRYSIGAWAICLIVGLLTIRKARFDYCRANRFLNIFAIMLVGIILAQIAFSAGQRQSWYSARKDYTEKHDSSKFTLAQKGIGRDIYYLVFDRYASNDVLKDQFRFDNQRFYEELRHRKFFCVPEACTNYPATVASMSSALSMAYHPRVCMEEAEYAEILQSNLVAKLLKGAGYSYYHFGNWYEPLRNNSIADWNLSVSPAPTEFADVILDMTPFAHVFSPLRGDRKFVLRKFDKLAEVVADPDQTFVYAHFILPHPPFIFNKDGSKVRVESGQRITRRDKYIEQLQFTNSRILQLMDTILARSEMQPIIVIQADEGPQPDNTEGELSREDLLRRRLGIITALYLPGVDVEGLNLRRFTPVNTFRLIFNLYFDASIPLKKDRLFFLLEDDSFKGAIGRGLHRGKLWTDVTDEVW